MTSVIIRNHNEEQYIGFAIQSVIDHIPNPEIIIIDDHSTDDSMSVVKLFNTRANITVHSIDDYSPGKALNYGAQLATHDMLLVLSAHSQITAMNIRWVESNLKSNFAAIFGNQIPIYRGKRITKRYIWSHFLDDREVVDMHSDIENRPFLHNAFCFYNKQILLENPFDETLSGKEDRYWAADILSKGKSYLYTPSIAANHYYTKNGATWKGLG